jgi:hypothetical protein
MGITVWAGLGWIVFNAGAGSFAERPFEDTIQSSAAVIRGTVGNTVRTEWGDSPTGSKAIYTFSEFNVSEWLKGDASGNRVLIRQLGGEKDGQAMQVPGVPSLHQGEELVLVLRNGGSDSTFDIQGMSLGRYEIVRGPDGEEILQGYGATTLQPRTLQSVRDLIKAQKSQPQPSSSPSAARGLQNPVSGNVSVVHDGDGSPHEPQEGNDAGVENPSTRSTRRVVVIFLGVLAALGFYVLRRRNR